MAEAGLHAAGGGAQGCPPQGHRGAARSLLSNLVFNLSVQGLVDAKQYYYDLTTVTEFKK